MNDSVPNKVWICEKKGLRKELIDFQFVSMIKPNELSKCLAVFEDVQNIGERETIFLKNKNKTWIELGTSITPIDYYIEQFLQEMFAGEKSCCYIKTKSEIEISFTIKLLQINYNKNIYNLRACEVFDLASRYKDNGVKMFKKYPLFAQEYFCRAAKYLISYKPFELLNEEENGINSQSMEKLFNNIQLNIAACLIKQERYEDVLYVTKFIENTNLYSEKGIYRRAFAFYKLKEFSEAKDVIERIFYKDKKELQLLYSKILLAWKEENAKYKSVIKKMFN